VIDSAASGNYVGSEATRERLIPVTTAPVVAQVSRSTRQVQLHRFLRGCDVISFEPSQSKAVGALLAAASLTDVVDAHVIIAAAQLSFPTVVTSDPRDLSQLADQASTPLAIRSI
jgi:hypothetical protein